MRRVLAWLNLNRVATALGVLVLILLSGVIGAQTNYLGTVFIADSTTPSQQAAVTASGEIKVDCTTGCSGGGGGTSNVNLIQIGGSSIAIGQAAMAASLPVVLASNQSSKLAGYPKIGKANFFSAKNPYGYDDTLWTGYGLYQNGIPIGQPTALTLDVLPRVTQIIATATNGLDTNIQDWNTGSSYLGQNLWGDMQSEVILYGYSLVAQ